MQIIGMPTFLNMQHAREDTLFFGQKVISSGLWSVVSVENFP